MSAAGIIRDGAEMVRRMQPERVPGRYVFRSLTAADLTARLAEIRGVFVEAEGPSAILPAEDAAPDAMAQITLRVHSALDGVGLTAAVSGALDRAGIPCNMVAATHHDHLFVPEDRAEAALAVLKALAAET